MNPPIREKSHYDRLWYAVRNNYNDTIGSDHAPHLRANKDKEYPDTPSGMPGVQTLLPVILNHVNDGKLSLVQLMNLVCENPAKILQVSRSDGDIAVASTVWLDFEIGPDVKNWDSRNGYSEGFHDVLILGNSVTFQPGEATALFELPIVAGSHSESDEWLDVTVRPQYPNLYSNVPDSALRLSIIDA